MTLNCNRRRLCQVLEGVARGRITPLGSRPSPRGNADFLHIRGCTFFFAKEDGRTPRAGLGVRQERLMHVADIKAPHDLVYVSRQNDLAEIAVASRYALHEGNTRNVAGADMFANIFGDMRSKNVSYIAAGDLTWSRNFEWHKQNVLASWHEDLRGMVAWTSGLVARDEAMWNIIRNENMNVCAARDFIANERTAVLTEKYEAGAYDLMPDSDMISADHRAITAR